MSQPGVGDPSSSSTEIRESTQSLQMGQASVRDPSIEPGVGHIAEVIGSDVRANYGSPDALCGDTGRSAKGAWAG